MKKVTKIMCIVAILALILVSNVYATGINMNMTENETANTTSTRQSSPTRQTTVNATNNNSAATVSTVQESNIDDGLGLTNILNILIIVVGVVLILLAIAILIRLHA